MPPPLSLLLLEIFRGTWGEMIFDSQIALLDQYPDFRDQLLASSLNPIQIQAAISLLKGLGEGMARAFLVQMDAVLHGSLDIRTIVGWPADFAWICQPRDQWPDRISTPFF